MSNMNFVPKQKKNERNEANVVRHCRKLSLHLRSIDDFVVAPTEEMSLIESRKRCTTTNVKDGWVKGDNNNVGKWIPTTITNTPWSIATIFHSRAVGESGERHFVANDGNNC